MGRFNPGTHQNKAIKMFTKRLRTCVETGEALSSLFDNNYLRCDLMKSFFVTFCCVTCFWTIKKQWVGLTESHITFVLLEIVWWNLAVMRKYELPLSLYNLIKKLWKIIIFLKKEWHCFTFVQISLMSGLIQNGQKK